MTLAPPAVLSPSALMQLNPVYHPFCPYVTRMRFVPGSPCCSVLHAGQGLGTRLTCRFLLGKNLYKLLLPQCKCMMHTSSFTCFARSATSPSFAYVSNPAPNSSLCRAPAPQLCLLQLLLPDCIDPLQLLLPVCVRFSSAVRLCPLPPARCLHPLQLLLPDCVHFNCSPIASASAALPDCVRFNCYSPIVCFNCCSPIASACDSSPCPTFSNIPSWSSRFSTYT